MTVKKTLRQREMELRVLLPTPEGKLQLQELASGYALVSGQHAPPGGSLITYILIHERESGLISV